MEYFRFCQAYITTYPGLVWSILSCHTHHFFCSKLRELNAGLGGGMLFSLFFTVCVIDLGMFCVGREGRINYLIGEFFPSFRFVSIVNGTIYKQTNRFVIVAKTLIMISHNKKRGSAFCCCCCCELTRMRISTTIIFFTGVLLP